MSEQRKEQLSALMDGELGNGAQSTIDDLLQTASLKTHWARYHLISDSLQQKMPATVDTGLAARISAGIQDEPAILAPGTVAKITVLKPLAGLAIAASIAAMAILGIQQNQEEVDFQGQQIVSFTPQKTVNAPVPRQVLSSTATEAQLRQVKANARARLNSYLVNYNEYRTHSGYQGMLPYARTVTFENNQ